MTLPDLASIVLPGIAGTGLGCLLMAWHWWQADRSAFNARNARLASLTASLDDAHREVERLTGEKHARDIVIHQGIEVLQSLHAQGEQP